jgi:predicted permease
MQVLRASGRTAGLAGGRIRSGVVIAEVALSFVLLIGSGLMIRSFLALQHVDLGYDPHNLLTFQLLEPFDRSPERRAASIRSIYTHLRDLPGVQNVTAAVPFPLTGNFNPIRWGREPALTDPSKFQAADVQIVYPGYFEAMHAPLLAGRTFNDADNAPTRKVVLIDQALASKAFPHEEAVGKRILVRINTPEPEWVEVIGVIGHQRQTSIAQPGREQIFFTDGFLQHGVVGRWAVRTARDPGSYTGLIRSEMAKIDTKMLITETQPMEALVEKAQAGTRFSLLLIGVFAVIAAFLAAIGLYGVLSTVVRQRTAEIGVRVALGAAPSSIFGLIVGHGLRLSAVGIGLGAIAALMLTRAMTSMLVGVRPTDPMTFAVMAVVFFLVAAIGSWLPARRAANLAPTEALRQE